MTQISIPNTGYKVGTCGWLAKGISDGTIKIAPSTSKGGKDGLWLFADGKSGCLAILNEFDLSDSELRMASRFGVICEDFAGSFPLTESAEKYLREAAQDWCDSANECRENDIPEMPKLVVAVA